MAAIDGALRHCNPTSTLCVGLARLAISSALLSLDDINTNRLFAVDVLSGNDGRIEVLYVEEGWRRDLDKIDFGGTGELLEGVRAVEEQFAADGLPVKAGVELIKMAAAGRKLIWKKIGQRYHLGRRVFRERCRDCSAARAPAK